MGLRDDLAIVLLSSVALAACGGGGDASETAAVAPASSALSASSSVPSARPGPESSPAPSSSGAPTATAASAAESPRPAVAPTLATAPAVADPAEDETEWDRAEALVEDIEAFSETWCSPSHLDEPDAALESAIAEMQVRVESASASARRRASCPWAAEQLTIRGERFSHRVDRAVVHLDERAEAGTAEERQLEDLERVQRDYDDAMSARSYLDLGRAILAMPDFDAGETDVGDAWMSVRREAERVVVACADDDGADASGE